MRLRCHLLGCVEATDAPCCHRCAAYIYDPAFLERGRFDPLFASWRRLTGWTQPRCHSCGKRRWPWSRWWQPDHCSAECLTRWIPF